MLEVHENQISNFLETLDKLREFVEKNVCVTQTTQTEKVEQANETIDATIETPTQTKIVTTEQPNEETINNPEMRDITSNVAEILSLVRISNRKDEINKELHEELQSYKSGLRRDILLSVLKNIIRWHDTVSEQYNYYKKQREENADFSTLFPILLKEYKNLADGLENLLYDYDIEVEIPNVGEEFNPRTQKQVRAIPTDDATMEHKIAECINAGFRDTATGRLLKQPEVVVFQHRTEI